MSVSVRIWAILVVKYWFFNNIHLQLVQGERLSCMSTSEPPETLFDESHYKELGYARDVVVTLAISFHKKLKLKKETKSCKELANIITSSYWSYIRSGGKKWVKKKRADNPKEHAKIVMKALQVIKQFNEEYSKNDLTIPDQEFLFGKIDTAKKRLTDSKAVADNSNLFNFYFYHGLLTILIRTEDCNEIIKLEEEIRLQIINSNIVEERNLTSVNTVCKIYIREKRRSLLNSAQKILLESTTLLLERFCALSSVNGALVVPKRITAMNVMKKIFCQGYINEQEEKERKREEAEAKQKQLNEDILRQQIEEGEKKQKQPKEERRTAEAEISRSRFLNDEEKEENTSTSIPYTRNVENVTEKGKGRNREVKPGPDYTQYDIEAASPVQECISSNDPRFLKAAITGNLYNNLMSSIAPKTPAGPPIPSDYIYENLHGFVRTVTICCFSTVKQHSEFQTKVLDASKKCVVFVEISDYYCNACESLWTKLKEMIPKKKGKANLVKINKTDQAELCNSIKENIQSTPLLLVYKDGNIVEERSGNDPDKRVTQKLVDKYCPN